MSKQYLLLTKWKDRDGTTRVDFEVSQWYGEVMGQLKDARKLSDESSSKLVASVVFEGHVVAGGNSVVPEYIQELRERQCPLEKS